MSAGYDELRWKIDETKRSLALPGPRASGLRATIYRGTSDKGPRHRRRRRQPISFGLYRIPQNLVPAQNEHSRNEQ
jgi:hypothetical protein